MIEKSMKPAFTEVGESQDAPYRFVKDEKSALKFINEYDASKVGIKDTIQKSAIMYNDCNYLKKDAKQLEFCVESIFTNYQYFRGLIYGMQTYGWKPSTVELGKKKIFDYLKANTESGLPLINYAISYGILDFYTKAFPQKNIDSKLVIKQRAEVEKDIQDLRKSFKNDDSMACKAVQKRIKKEMEIADKYRVLLSQLLP